MIVLFVPPWDPGHLSAGVFWRGEVYLARDQGGEARDLLDAILFNRRPLHHSEGLGATVDVFEKMNGGRQLAINGKIVASAYFPDVRLQLMMGGWASCCTPIPATS